MNKEQVSVAAGVQSYRAVMLDVMLASLMGVGGDRWVELGQEVVMRIRGTKEIRKGQVVHIGCVIGGVRITVRVRDDDTTCVLLPYHHIVWMLEV